MKMIRSFLALAALAGALFLSCKKHKGPSLPDVSNFSVVDSGTFIPGGRGTVTVNSTMLADGTYTVYYFIFPDGFVKPYRTAAHATLAMRNHTGTFQTEPLDTPNFVILQLDSIINEAGGGASINYLVTLTDSVGMMTVKMNGRDTFRAPNVTATYEGGMVQVSACSPRSGIMGTYRYVVLYLEDNLGVHSFNNSTHQGAYSAFIDSATFPNTFVEEEVTITALTPLLTGSFSATCADSTKMSGTFSCPAPR
jgi:hypothetical protein